MLGGLGYLNKLGASGGLVFSPGQLFSGGEQGAWYDPSDNSTMFQDAAGTTPVTAVEQAVGLILDKSKGLVLGPELVANGSFSSAASWSTPIAGASITGGALTFDGVTSIASGVQVTINTPTAAIVAGRTYLVSYTIISGTTNNVSVAVGNTVTSVQSAAGTYTQYVVATDSSPPDIRTRSSSGIRTGSIDNFSVRELPGNHAFQSTLASRPTLRARYNLLERSEEFGNAYWTVSNASISSNATIAPDGTTTADKLVENVTNDIHTVYRTNLVAGTYTLSFFAKAAERDTVQLQQESGGNSRFVLTGAGTATALGANSVSIQAVGDGWYRCISSFTTTAPWGAYFILYNGNTSYPGDGTSGLFIWGAQLTNPAVFPSNTYQRIAAATDYATGASFPLYLAFDGTDDSLLTSSVNFSATDKMTVFAGLSRLGTADAMVVELSADAGANNGTFYFGAPLASGSWQYAFLSRGTSNGVATVTSGFSPPVTNVLTLQGDISGDASTIRANGTQVGSATTDQGTGNYGNYPLYIGRRNNATLPFNGRIYSLIVRGAASNTTQVAQTEKWVANKTPLGTV